MTRNLTRLGLTALTLVAGQGLYAQDATTGAVYGSVKNNKGVPLANARIFLDGGRGNTEFRADAAGQFRATGLIPGKYNLVVTADGYEGMRKQTINVGLGQRTPVNVVLSTVASVTVEVVAAANQLDASTVTSGTQFSSETFAALPLGRSFTAVAAMAPGVVSSGIDSSNPSIGGGSGLENQYVIDGANTTNPGYGSSGSFSSAYGSLGSGINTDFIQEVQVKSFAMDAEYGQTTGGIINAITKSGTNTFEGTAFAYFDVNALQAKDRNVVLDGVAQPIFSSYNRTELGFTAAGPVIKDKLFFFVGYNPITENKRQTAPFQTDGSRFPLTGNTYDQKKNTNAYYGKLQYQFNADHLLELSAFGDPGERPNGPQLAADFRATEGKFSKLNFGSNTMTAKYNGVFFSNFLVEARISKSKNEFKRAVSTLGDSEWQVLDTWQNNLQLSPNAAGRFEQNLTGESKQYDLKLSKSIGIADFKVGILREDVTYDSTTQYSGPKGFSDPHQANTIMQTGEQIQKRYMTLTPIYTTSTSTAAQVDAARLNNLATMVPYYRVIRGNYSSPSIHTKTTYTAMFAQGTFKFGNFNLKAGLRMEEQELVGEQVTYKFKGSDNLSPRLGMTYDVDGTGKSKIYGFFGRYYEKVPLDIAVRALSTEKGVNRSDFAGMTGFTNLINPILNGTSIGDLNPDGDATAVSTHFRVTGDQSTKIVPGTKSMYQDEYVLGYDFENTSGVNFSNRFIYRNLGRILEDVSLDGNNYYIANPGQNENAIRGMAAYTGAATFPAPERKYWAFEWEARKSTSKYSAFANVKFSKLEGNYEGLYRGDNGQQDPNISSLYDLPIEQMADSARGLSGKEQFISGPLPSDRLIVTNFGYTYVFDNGISAGILGRVMTGTPITSFVAHPVYENAGEIPRWGRGDLGRTPTIYTFDTTFSYLMKLGGKKTLTFRGDVFNLFNQTKGTEYDGNMDVGLGTVNTNYTKAIQYDTARRIRLGVRFGF